MGCGSWTTDDFKNYSMSRGLSTTDDGVRLCKAMSTSQVYTQKSMASELNPFNVMRECRDTEEHPETVPVILALDVTGSMGKTAVEVSAEINTIMTEIYKTTKDVQFMIMGIGDFAYDDAPLQVSQFESDIRIAEQLDKVYFEFGGGANPYESYTAAWAFGISQCDLDCWKRGKKGIIITMGDEQLNPYIPAEAYRVKTNHNELDLNTADLYEKASKKYDIYHINVDHRDYHKPRMTEWNNQLGADHVITATVKEVPQVISGIISSRTGDRTTVSAEEGPEVSSIEFTQGISW